MINIYDFICSNSSLFKQLKFGADEIFIDYLCPITEKKARVWTHKNCLIYVTSGTKGYASVDNYHESQPHQLLFARKGGLVIHQYLEKPYRALIFMFDDSAVTQLLTDYPNLISSKVTDDIDLLETPAVMELKTSPFVESIFRSSYDYLQHPTTESRISLEFKFKELMVNLLREKDANSFYHYLYFLCKNERLAFIKLIQDNGHYNFTIEELARAANMSPSTFKRMFKKYLGASPGDWLRQRRITRAKNLLTNSDKNISDVAFELGYSDTASFSKAFKIATDLYPTDFVKKQVV